MPAPFIVNFEDTMKKLITLLAAIAFSATAVLPAAAAEPNELVPVAAPAAEAAKPVHAYKAKKAKKAKTAKKVKKAAKAKHKAKRAYKRHA
jgi:hypothetical protein